VYRMNGLENKLLVKGEFVLKKMQMKGGWTYAEMPASLTKSGKPFGFIRVKGTIDTESISAYHLMPMGNGNLFLPVKAMIRKRIKKEEGDTIYVEIFEDNQHLDVPKELMDCLDMDELIKARFYALKEEERDKIIKWIYEVKSSEAQEKRILVLINNLNSNIFNKL
jgi:hypothetical protein